MTAIDAWVGGIEWAAFAVALILFTALATVKVAERVVDRKGKDDK